MLMMSPPAFLHFGVHVSQNWYRLSCVALWLQWSTRQQTGRRFDAGGDGVDGGGDGGDGVYGVVSITIVGEVMVWVVRLSHLDLLTHSGPSGPTIASLNRFFR